MMQRRVHERLGLEKLSEHHIHTMTDASGFDYQCWNAKNCRRSVDAHFHERARSMSLSLFTIKVANTLIIYTNDHIAFDIPNFQDQKLLTRDWRSISEWGREREANSFCYKTCQYCRYEWSQPIAKQITKNARPKITDTPSTLILPCAYPQYVIIYIGVIYHYWGFGSLCAVFIYFLLHQNMVL